MLRTEIFIADAARALNADPGITSDCVAAERSRDLEIAEQSRRLSKGTLAKLASWNPRRAVFHDGDGTVGEPYVRARHLFDVPPQSDVLARGLGHFLADDL